jgi:hypothetical protein
MANALNSCEFFVPTSRTGDGQYLFGTQKITVKVMDGKLVVKSGGSFMLIEEFLNFNAQQEMIETMVSNSPDEKPRKSNAMMMSSSGRASPKRASFAGS